MDLEQIIKSAEITSNRLFGIEIEINGLDPWRAENALLQANITARREDYNHSRRTWWKVTTDGSLSGRERSCEVVSPPLPYNQDSLKLVAAVITVLREAGATVDNSCGIHVHVDSRDVASIMADFSRAIFLRYRESEDIIDQMVASSRRGNSNNFCRSLKNINRTANFRSLRYDRYQKLNFCSFERHGTLEFRQHEGSLDPNKIVSWVIFCITFFETTLEEFRQNGVPPIEETQLWTE